VNPYLVVVALALLAGGAGAQTISALTVEPAQARVGEPVQIKVAFENTDSPNCNLRLHFGDGTNRDHKVNQPKDVPLVRSHTYTKAGEYTVKAEGKTALPMLKCPGANQTARVTVTAAAPTAARAPRCPAGWTLEAKSVNLKTGAFSCRSKAGTAAPAARADCPVPLKHFENKARGQFGCRP
jgi:hypothetical protein